MMLRVLAMIALAAPSSAISAVLQPTSAGYLSSYPDGFISGPNVLPDGGNAPRIFAGKAGVGAGPLTASEARAVFKFNVSSMREEDDLRITIKNWGTENAPGLSAGCFRISICPPLSSYSLVAAAGFGTEIGLSDYSVGRAVYDTATSPGASASRSISTLLADLGRPSILTFVIVPGSEGGSFFEAELSGTNEPSPVPIPAGWLMLMPTLASAALWSVLRQERRRAA